MRTTFIYIMLMLPILAWGQEERKYIRDGYKAYMDGDYNEAEVSFRKAEEEKNNSYVARYNTSAALYQQNKLDESGKRFSELLQETADPAEQAKLLHNIGNVMVEGQQYQQAVEAYKRSLKINPDADDTRYNLAYALEKLREQQQQQQNQDQNKQQNKDQQDKQDQKNQQQNDQDQQNQQQEQDQQQQQQDQQRAEQDDQQQQQAQPQQLTQEEAERLLNAILQKEKDVKEEVDKKKAKAAKIRTDKDW